MIVAIALARWMAVKFSSRFDGPWHNIVFWTTAIVATVIIFLALLYAVGWLFHRGDRRKTEVSDDESHKNPS